MRGCHRIPIPRIRVDLRRSAGNSAPSGLPRIPRIPRFPSSSLRARRALREPMPTGAPRRSPVLLFYRRDRSARREREERTTSRCRRSSVVRRLSSVLPPICGDLRRSVGDSPRPGLPTDPHRSTQIRGGPQCHRSLLCALAPLRLCVDCPARRKTQRLEDAKTPRKEEKSSLLLLCELCELRGGPCKQVHPVGHRPCCPTAETAAPAEKEGKELHPRCRLSSVVCPRSFPCPAAVPICDPPRSCEESLFAEPAHRGPRRWGQRALPTVVADTPGGATRLRRAALTHPPSPRLRRDKPAHR